MKNAQKIFGFLYVGLWIATLIFIAFIHHQPIQLSFINQDDNHLYEVLTGTVEKEASLSSNEEIQFHVRLDSDDTILASVSAMNNFNTYKPGDSVQIYKIIDSVTGVPLYEIMDFYYQKGLILLLALFSGVSLLVARKKGFWAIFSVLISLSLFYFIFLKMIPVGYSPLTACLFFISITTALTIPLIHGFNKKTLSALLAIFVGYILSIYISFLFKDLTEIGNTPGEEFRTLALMYPNIGLSEVIIASLFIGAAGALIDTAISISSAIFEALKNHPHQTFLQVYKTGMNVGKDILGSMINTLLFAYLASAIPFLILISMSKGANLHELINMDFIALELTRTFIGAISLVILIPVTASISAYFFTKFKLHPLS